MHRFVAAATLFLTLVSIRPSCGQTGLSKLPGYDNYQRVNQAVGDIASEGRVSAIQWNPDGNSMSFTRTGKQFTIDLQTLAVGESKESEQSKAQSESPPDRSEHRRPRTQTDRDRPGRAQQGTWVTSPDGKWIARYRDFNVVLEKVVDQPPKSAEESADQQPSNESPEAASDTRHIDPKKEHAQPEIVPVTVGGTADFRYGTCCWVYGEELSQSSAMWWSPDSRKLAFYELDERHMRDYYLTTDNTRLYTRVQIERYPKAGADNPHVGLLIYDLESKQTIRVSVSGDRQQYIYNIRFSPAGDALLLSRTNRYQDTLDVLAADSQTGQTRLVVTEKQPTWQKNRPLMQFLEDGERFIWETERTGWKHFELRHLDGRQLNTLSAVQPYPAESILQVDEKANLLYYTAHSSQNPNNAHLHRVRLDGTEHLQLTGQPLNHSSFDISPDHKWFVACAEAVDTPPITALFNAQGEQVAVLAEPNMEKATELKLSFGELFSFRANDGTTDIYGTLHKPAHFDPGRKYPLVVNVYGGPSARGIHNRFAPANAFCEFGYLIATIANRGTTGRGKAFESATYLGLGGADIQDQVDGIKWLCQRPYVDVQRVGIYGHSYGGYLSVLALLKYPEMFHAGVAGSPVTDWKNYDTIYTERYMRTPQENPEGYEKGSCLTYAKQLKGRLLVMHGLMDDNVHPANTWQLADVLQRASLRFDMLIYPNSKHGLGSDSSSVRWDYLHQHLRPEPLPEPVGR